MLVVLRHTGFVTSLALQSPSFCHCYPERPIPLTSAQPAIYASVANSTVNVEASWLRLVRVESVRVAMNQSPSVSFLTANTVSQVLHMTHFDQLLVPPRCLTMSSAPVVVLSPVTQNKRDILLRSPRQSSPEVSVVHQARQPPAVADQIPVISLALVHASAVPSLGQLSADRQTAVPTRVHESGGGTIHDRLARLASTGARPPPVHWVFGMV